jgi:geranylgeranyl diphosphate synthase type II
MDIHGYLKKRRSYIDRALERYFRQFNHHPKNLYQAMHYSVFSGGKRLRPILTLAVGEMFGAKQKTLLPFACAVELIHTYSLVHDDLPALDNDDMRRGRPATHKLFGEGMALLAGDALLTEAFNVLTWRRVVQSLEPKIIVTLIHEIAQAAGVDGLAGGQAVDLEAEGQKVDVATVECIHVRKTGALFLAAARIGARIGGATPEEIRRITRFTKFLGLAFQITDDILDAQSHPGDAHQVGAKSKEKVKATYPSIVGLGAAKARSRELMQNSLREIRHFGEAAERLKGIAAFVVERVH